MASRAERKEHLEQMTEDEFVTFSHAWGGEFMRKQGEARIKWLLDDAEKHGDAFDLALGLPTEQDQQRGLDEDTLTAAKRASSAAVVSAVAAVASIGISILAIVIAIMK